MAEARGDKAAGSPALSVAQTCSKKGSLSSLEDKMSQDVTPISEGIGTKPTDEAFLVGTFTSLTEFTRKRH